MLLGIEKERITMRWYMNGWVNEVSERVSKKRKQKKKKKVQCDDAVRIYSKKGMNRE